MKERKEKPESGEERRLLWGELEQPAGLSVME